MAAQVRVVIAEGQPLFRDGLARTVRRDPGLRLVAEIERASDVVAAIRRLVPDVVVLDAGLGATRVADAVAQHAIPTRIVVLSATVRPEEAFQAVAAGAHGYLSKRVNADIVRDAIRRVAAGGQVLCHEAQTVIVGEIRLRHGDERRLLPAREFEVLRLLADGLNNQEIGRRLNIAPTTVKSHCGRIYERLGVRDRMSAVVEAMRRGLLD
jgi:two-component system nitrate/nitrite response regulator NarL